MEKKSTKSIRARMILAFLLVILAVVLSVLYFNRNNIMALFRGLTTDSGTIGEMLQNNEKQTQTALSDAGIHVSEEDFSKLNNGELSEEEIAAIIYDSIQNASLTSDANAGQSTTELPENESPSSDDVLYQPQPDSQASHDKDSAKTDTNPVHVPEKTPASGMNTEENKGSAEHPNTVGTSAQKYPVKNDSGGSTQTSSHTGSSSGGASSSVSSGKLSEEEYNKKVSELVAKVYVIKANFTSTLSAFEASIIASYKALPAEQHTSATKARIVSENMSYVTGLEAQCDAQVKAVTDELSALMKENGKDTSLVNAINSAYANEKELKKAYYISLYK